MGCVSGRQRHRAKAIRNFPEFDKTKQLEFESIIVPNVIDIQTKIVACEAIRQDLMLAKAAADTEEKDVVKIDQLTEEFQDSWDELRNLYKSAMEKLDFCMQEYDIKTLDQNKLSKLLLDIGEEPIKENRNLETIKELLKKQAEFYGEEGTEITEEQYTFSKDELEGNHVPHDELSLESIEDGIKDGILALGSVVVATSPERKNRGACEGGRMRMFRKKKIDFARNYKEYDKDKQQTFDMTVLIAYDEMDSEKLILDSLYEDYQILIADGQSENLLQRKEMEINEQRNKLGNILIQISKKLEYISSKEFTNATFKNLDQKKLNLLLATLNIPSKPKTRELSFLSNAYKEIGEQHINAEKENENLARHMKDFTSLFDGDWAVDHRSGCF